jgi:DDHD domain
MMSASATGSAHVVSLEERLSIQSPTPPRGPTTRRSSRNNFQTSDDWGVPVSPLEGQLYYGRGSSNHHPNSILALHSLRHVTRVSKRAALATKEQFWDSNDAGIVAAQTAVDQWEQAYNALRGLLCAMGHSAHGLYGAAKAGANGLEHGLLVPVRDWILLPAFGGVEHVVAETVGFLQSDQTQVLAQQSFSLARRVPLVGENVLAPALCFGAEALRRTWEVAQYPIPHPQQVRDSVDAVLTGTKWALTTAGRELFLYVKRADANITRTLSHTQWKVLGSGPYATLDKLNKREVIDHFCERYFSTADPVARYELAAHVRAHNRPLYHDLVITGLLRERGGDLTEDDEWLSVRPRYRHGEASDFLLEDDVDGDAHRHDDDAATFALWFRLPYQNGERPKRDTPWVCFDRGERAKLEDKYRSVLKVKREGRTVMNDREGKFRGGLNIKGSDPLDHASALEPPTPQLEGQSDQVQALEEEQGWRQQKYATNATWYNPDLQHDLLLDQKRHCVTLSPCCPKCRKTHETVQPPLAPKEFGELCEECMAQHADAPWVDALLSPPPLIGVYRPTLWRFYGPGDEIRRATWFLDTQRNGPQPYGEDAQAVLEDAYLFLIWMSRRRVWDGSVLLTVQVPSPDGSENQLVQFSSLNSATAIGKGIGGAISIFKRRVYRGAYFSQDNAPSLPPPTGHANELLAEDEALTTISRLEDLKLSTSFDIETEANSDKNKEMIVEELDATAAKEDIEQAHLLDESQPQSIPESAFRRYGRSSLAFALKNDCDELLVGTKNKQSDKATDNDCDDPVDHLVLIVHGIGEMLQSFDFFGLKKVPTIVDCCGYLRNNHAEVLDARFSQMFSAIDGIPETQFDRVEYLPVEWHESFSIQSTRRLLTESPTASGTNRSTTSINDISLRTIPNLRQFANDTLMDVLYFMSPIHHDIIIDIVVNEMNFVVERFRKLTGFEGCISVVGHSLGSIIAWDILDHQHSDSITMSPIQQPESTSPEEEDQQQQDSGYPQLDFEVDNAFMLGSPIPVFLMIRNQRKPLAVDHVLAGCPRVFNIFHPYDPVSYRIEPLLHPSNADVEPKIMTHWNGGFRFQYQTKRLWKKIVDRTVHAQESVLRSVESSISALGLLDSANAGGDEEDASSQSSNGSGVPQSTHTIVTGRLNGGRRIDYMLQEKEIDRANEYVAALAAHSCYWLEKDLSLFIARQICLRALERAGGNDVNEGIFQTGGV